MLRKKTLIASLLVLSMLSLASCSVTGQQTPTAAPPNSSVTATPTVSPTSGSLCSNQYFPNTNGDTWDYSGSNNAIGSYTRTDTVTNAKDSGFTLQTEQSGITFALNYTCSPAGLTAVNPVQQYVGALLNDPSVPVNVKLNSNSGISLPAKINPGDTWQQSVDWEGTSENINMNGTFVFDYTAAGYEKVTVPYGTFDALRVNVTIRVEVSGFKILVGTYDLTNWLVPGVGLIKSEGTSHVPGVEFNDSMQLNKFTPAQ